MAGSLRGNTDDVDVVLDCLLGGLLGCLEQRTDVDIETQVGKGGGNHLLPPIVSVLTELGHQQPGTTALELEELMAKRIQKGDMEAEIADAFLLHMKGVRELAAGDFDKAASLLQKADRGMLYWGQGPAILKMFNQMNLAAALERAGKPEKAEAVLDKVRQVNPQFAESYAYIRDEIGD